MKDNFKNKLCALIKKKTSLDPDSDSDNISHVHSDDEYYVEFASSVAMTIKYFGKFE